MMDDAELAVIAALAAAWNRYLALPEAHPSDRREFEAGIHRLQEKIMARGARRAHPEVFR